MNDAHPHYALVERAIGLLLDDPALSLGRLAQRLQVSEFHLQRTFSEWAGVSPKRFAQFLGKEHAKALLRASHDVLGSALDAGLSSPGRLHDLLVTCDGVSPGEVRALGAGLEIRHALGPTPFGRALVAVTARGICHLRFVEPGGDAAALDALRAEWPLATHVADDAALAQLRAAADPAARVPLKLWLRGTNFQIKVWEALLRVPVGAVVTYAALAQAIGRPRAVRAAASAVAHNPVALLVPCHRVIRAEGVLGQYRWGAARKAAVLGWEAARRAA